MRRGLTFAQNVSSLEESMCENVQGQVSVVFADNQPMEVEKPMQTPIVLNHVETIEQIPVSELQESASNQ